MSVRFPEFRPRTLIRAAPHTTIVNTLFNGTVGSSLSLLATGISDAINAAMTLRNRAPGGRHLEVQHSVTGAVVFEVTDGGPSGVGQSVNVKAFGAAGDGTDDTAAIDAAWAAVTSNPRGGVLEFPAGTYLYAGAGLSNNPQPGVVAPVWIRGAGIGSTLLVFADTASPATPCITLASQSTVGSGVNYGSGIEDLSIQASGGKDVVQIRSLELWSVHRVSTYGGRVVWHVVESRNGAMEHISSIAWTQTGLKVTGEAHATSHLEECTFVGDPAATGFAVDYQVTAPGAFDAGGVYLREVVVNAAAGGMRFASTVLQPLFVFLDRSVIDGSFPLGGLVLERVTAAIVSDAFWGNAASGGVCCRLDGVNFYVQTGGHVYAGTATGASYDLRNACSNVSLSGVALNGVAGATAYKTDATNHTNVNLDNPAVPAVMTLSNDQSRLLAASSPSRVVSPVTMLTSNSKGAASNLVLQDETLSSRVHLRTTPVGGLEVVNHAYNAVIATLSDTGGLVLPGPQTLTGVISPAQLTANTDNWNPTGLSGARVIRISTDASRNLTGIVAMPSGRLITIHNVGAQNLVLVHDATSTAANRFLMGANVNLTMAPNTSCDVWYDSVSSRWRYAGT